VGEGNATPDDEYSDDEDLTGALIRQQREAEEADDDQGDEQEGTG
jgi:hypothetical protein